MRIQFLILGFKGLKGKSRLQFNGSLKGQHFSGALIFYVNSEYIHPSVCQKDRSVNMIDDSIKR